MAALATSLLVVSLVVSAEAEMPADFLKVESEAWNRWLDEVIQVTWTRIPLEHVLAGEFGTAELAVDDPDALKEPITLDAAGLTRRAAFWRLSQRYDVTLPWAQENGEWTIEVGRERIGP